MSLSPQTIETLIQSSSYALIGSVDSEGFPNVKAMLPPRRREGLRRFWFTTNTSSMRVAQYRQDPQACVYFADPMRFQGAMFMGRMQVLEAAATKELIWHDGDTLYYPGGVTDPDYCVLLFEAEKCRSYGNFSSETVVLS